MKRRRAAGASGGARLPIAAAGGLLLAAAVLGANSPSAWPPMDPSRVAWRSLTYRASKFFLSAQATVEYEPASGPGGPVVLTLRSRGLGEESTLTLWLDPRDAVARRQQQLQTGRRNRLKLSEHHGATVHVVRRSPRDEAEAGAAPESWSDVVEERLELPVPAGEALTEPTALFYLLTASPLERPGDERAALVLSRGHLFRVVLRAERLELHRVEVATGDGAGRGRWIGGTPAVRVSLRAEPVGEAAPDERTFRFVGLSRDIELLVDLQSGIPLEISGRLRRFGRLRIRLAAARFAG